MKKIKILTFLVFNFIFFISLANKADMVIYSYNRPLQLYALLESINHYISGLNEVHVIYRASNSDFAHAYETVSKDFPNFIFVKQGLRPSNDFQPLMLSAVFNSSSDYIIFSVDDIIVKDFVNLSECIEVLEKTNAYGFFLRLGKNIISNYSPASFENLYRTEEMPELYNVKKDIYTWQFDKSKNNWRYANSNDMTLYRKNDIKNDFLSIRFVEPNEHDWAARSSRVMHRYGLCFETSKIVNVPLNRVQNNWPNRHMEVSTGELLDIFNRGLKIDISKFHKVRNFSPHQEFDLQYILRN